MEAGILCQIIASKIDGAKFCLYGLDMHWYNEADNTSTNQAIIADCIANYDTCSLPFVKAEQTQIVKNKMRGLLSQSIGDYGDNISDITRAIVLAEGIRNGSITDPAIISGYAQYCTAMVEMYGGAQAILDVLNQDLQGLQTYLASYYTNKTDIDSATNTTDVTNIATNVINTKVVVKKIS